MTQSLYQYINLGFLIRLNSMTTTALNLLCLGWGTISDWKLTHIAWTAWGATTFIILISTLAKTHILIIIVLNLFVFFFSFFWLANLYLIHLRDVFTQIAAILTVHRSTILLTMFKFWWFWFIKSKLIELLFKFLLFWMRFHIESTLIIATTVLIWLVMIKSGTTCSKLLILLSSLICVVWRDPTFIYLLQIALENVVASTTWLVVILIRSLRTLTIPLHFLISFFY